jgi:hypothetical protein
MSKENTAVFGIFSNRAQVERVVDTLISEGFRTIGGTLGVLAGIGALAIPGLGPFIAAGPIMAALAGAGTAGVVGGLLGALVGMGMPEYEAKRYEGLVRSGHVLISVHCDNSDWVKRAKDVLERSGGRDVASAGESSGDYAQSDKPKVRYGGGSQG